MYGTVHRSFQLPSSSSATRIAYWIVVGYRVRVYISSHLRWVLSTHLFSLHPWPNGRGDLLPTNTIYDYYTAEHLRIQCLVLYRRRWNDSWKEYSASSPQQSSSLRSLNRYHTWSLSTKNISIYTNANPLPLVL